MDVPTFRCDCGREDTAPAGSPRSLTRTCFKCHVRGVGFRFRGVQGGRESFHEDTVRSVTEETFHNAKIAGVELEPKPTGAVSPTAAFAAP